MVARTLPDESNELSQAGSKHSGDSAEPKAQTRDIPSNEDCSPDDDDEEVDWDEEKENEEGEEDQDDLDEIESDDDEDDCCLDACEPSALASVEQARQGIRRMQTLGVLDGNEEGEPEEREEEQVKSFSIPEDKSGVTAEVEGAEGLKTEEDAAGGSEGAEEDGEEKGAEAIAEPQPRADGFMGSSAADCSGVTMRRELSWVKPKGAKKGAGERESKDARGARGERGERGGQEASQLGSFRFGRTPSVGRRAGDVVVGPLDRKPSSLSSSSSSSSFSSTATSASSASATAGRGGGGVDAAAYEVRWLLTNDKFLPIHAKVHVTCRTDHVVGHEGGHEAAGHAAGVTGDVGETRVLVPQRSAEVVVARVQLPDPRLLSQLEVRWWFGLGRHDAAHSPSVRYSLPFSGKPRHVCQAFGGKYSHTGRLHYSVDVDLPPGHQVRACRSGVVQALCNTHDKVRGPSRKFSGMANFVHILHSDGTVGCYMHFQHNGVTCRLGSKVKRGQVIGFIGLTGFTSRPHIHFHVKKHGNYFEGTEWETVPILFKTSNSKGLVLKKGCWYENRAGVAAMTRAAAKTKKKKPTASAPAAAQDAAPASAS